MSQGIEAITSAAVALALDAAGMRQQAIASNIANASTEGYVPLRVSFESQLEDARRALETRGRLDATALTGVQPRMELVPVDEMGMPAKVMLDAQVADMAQNAVHYQALVRGLSKHYGILSAAVNEGKR